MSNRLRDAVHAAAWVAASTLASPAAFAQCGHPDLGSCCEIRDTPYCSDPACCEAVCELDPFCCATAWDEYCVEIAGAVCEACAPNPVLVVAFSSAVTLPNGMVVSSNDLAAFDLVTHEWSLYFDGSDVDLTRPIGAATRLEGGDLLITTVGDGSLPSLAGGPAGNAYTQNDILRFTPTSLGDETAGDWSFYFDGSDVGLSSGGGAIKSLSVLEDGCLVISTKSGGNLPGPGGSFKANDLVKFVPFSLGSWTSGIFLFHFDGSDVKLTSGGEKLDAGCALPDGRILLSTTGTYAVPQLSGGPGDLVAFTPNSLGQSTSGSFAMFYSAADLGLGGANIQGAFLAHANWDAVELRPDCGVPSTGSCCEVRDMPFCSDGECCEIVCGIDAFCCESAWDEYCAAAAVELCSSCTPPDRVIMSFGSETELDGDVVAMPADLAVFDPANNSWSLFFDGSDVGLGGNIAAATLLPDGDLLIAMHSSGSLAGLAGGPNGSQYTSNDILRFTPTSLGGATEGTWSFYFDGSDVGLNGGGRAIRTLSVDESGDIILATKSGGSVNGAGGFKASDLVRFSPTTLGASTDGTWSFHFDGSDVGLTSGGEKLDAACLQADGSIVLSMSGNYSVTGLSGGRSDLVRFVPNSLGQSTQGNFATFLSSQQLGLPSGANVQAAFTLTAEIPTAPERPDGGDGGDGGGDGGDGGDGGGSGAVCGEPAAGDCCSANGTPNCADGACCSMVCEIDLACCEIEWDSSCASIAAMVCVGCGGGDAGDGGTGEGGGGDNGGGDGADAGLQVGTHAAGPSYFAPSVAFANLIYSSISDETSMVRAGDRPSFFTGGPHFTIDGWPVSNVYGPLSADNPARAYLSRENPARTWSILNLPGEFSEPPQVVRENTYKEYDPPAFIRDNTFSFDVSVYWEGTGRACVTQGAVIADRPVSSVNFVGPEGQGPFGDGPRTMSKSTISLDAPSGSAGLMLHIYESDPANPLRNVIILVSNVRVVGTDELVYAGFDETTYRPFQLNPAWQESHQHFSHLRSLGLGHASFGNSNSPPYERTLINHATGELWEGEGSVDALVGQVDWTPRLREFGYETGFGAINRPTHACFGRSLRAIIEMCNQLDADLWWCHPHYAVHVGTRNADGSVQVARLRGGELGNPDQTGSLLSDLTYVDGFVDEIERHLKPELKVFHEWTNEVWNWSSWYWWATYLAHTYAQRLVLEESYGGDGGLISFASHRTLDSPAIYAGAQLSRDANANQHAFAALASARLAEDVRSRLETRGSSRELIAVASGQFMSMGRSRTGLANAWAGMPKLFKQLDAVATAPYRSWWVNDPAAGPYPWDELLIGLGASGAWDYNEAVRMTLSPHTSDGSWWHTYGFVPFSSWKALALDHPIDGYTRTGLPPGWDPEQRRWNLSLLTYEGGNHHLPKLLEAKHAAFTATMDPRYANFMGLYMDTAFASGIKGLLRAAETPEELELFRHGVPAGIEEDAEPLHSAFTFLSTTNFPSVRHGSFWGLQWWDSQIGSPQAVGVREAIAELQGSSP